MHPYVIDRMVAERQQELTRLRRADDGVRAARCPRPSAWRRALGRALVAVAVALGVPRSHRRAAQRRITAVLGFEPPC